MLIDGMGPLLLVEARIQRGEFLTCPASIRLKLSRLLEGLCSLLSWHKLRSVRLLDVEVRDSRVGARAFARQVLERFGVVPLLKLLSLVNHDSLHIKATACSDFILSPVGRWVD